MVSRFCGILALSLLLSACGSEAEQQGRRGNTAYESEQYAEAARAYQAGLGALDEAVSTPARTGLWNNLGAARYRQEKYKEARNAFRAAIATAASDTMALTRAQYNAGNGAAQAKKPDTALAHYRHALRTAPTHQDAKFNYEFVKRNQPPQKKQQKQKNKQQQQQQEQPAPSPYAQKLKAQADALVQRRKYGAAHRLMKQGQKVDRTVSAYKTFIDRLRDVNDIDKQENP